MKKINLLKGVATIVFLLFISWHANSASANEVGVTETDFRWNNENWFTLPHPEPATFTVTDNKEAFGTTTTGIPFSQINILEESNLRVQKFIIQDHFHYIVNGFLVYNFDLLPEEVKLLESNEIYETKSASSNEA